MVIVVALSLLPDLTHRAAMTQRYELTDVQRCDLRIGSIEGVERLLRGETVADFLEEFWGLWKVVHGESLARPRASRRGRAAPVGYQDVSPPLCSSHSVRHPEARACSSWSRLSST